MNGNRAPISVNCSILNSMHDDIELLRSLIREVLQEATNKPRKGMKSRWSLKYKRSIDCSHPKGFSQKNYCKRRKRGGAYKDE